MVKNALEMISEDHILEVYKAREKELDVINPRRACAERVTVVVSCVCMSVRTRYSGSTRN